MSKCTNIIFKVWQLTAQVSLLEDSRSPLHCLDTRSWWNLSIITEPRFKQLCSSVPLPEVMYQILDHSKMCMFHYCAKLMPVWWSDSFSYRVGLCQSESKQTEWYIPILAVCKIRFNQKKKMLTLIEWKCFTLSTISSYIHLCNWLT
jgi:hypothetical protein